MKKLAMLLVALAVLFTTTACTSRNGGGDSQGLGNSGSAQNSSSNSTKNSVSPGQGNGSRQPGENQQVDAYYSMDDLITRVKQAGCIDGTPEPLDVKAIGAVKGVAYGNVVFLDYEFTDKKEFTDAYAANKVLVKGKDAKIGAINGPYVMAFLNHNIDEQAVKAFHSLGFGG
ncbi:hypothetical protein H8K20_01655 [Neobittarella massiliensis]|uniref:Lipoprotein n=1 Tax=Neobittarella massiliensis (ex Bilen et al. 2018) TaxID=2041842 RepID=A0A8J6ILR7_9FIRM|nr:hypothetical protein [Neobittarella massiliensis]MBC3515097.1 hypothetical protein [Neobittarella massiliensis]